MPRPDEMSEDEVETRYGELFDRVAKPRVEALIDARLKGHAPSGSAAAADANTALIVQLMQQNQALTERLIDRASGSAPTSKPAPAPKAKLDKDGKPVFDADGKPVMEPIDPASLSADDDKPLTRKELEAHLAERDKAKPKSRAKNWL